MIEDKDDLGNAIRKIRVDMGINIELPELSITQPVTPASRHSAVGTIGYKAVDPEEAIQSCGATISTASAKCSTSRQRR